jgi:hypothetical protein
MRLGSCEKQIEKGKEVLLIRNLRGSEMIDQSGFEHSQSFNIILKARPIPPFKLIPGFYLPNRRFQR